MTVRQFIAAIFCVVVGAGCTPMSKRQLHVPEEFDLQKNGVAFLSLGYKARSVMDSYSLLFRRVGDVDMKEVFYAIPRSPLRNNRGTIRDGDAVLELVGHQLSTGDYEIYGFAASFDGGMMRGRMESKQPFSFRFQITPGRIVYLGSYQYIQTYGKNFFGHTVPSGGAYAIADETARDSAKLVEMRPELLGRAVVKNLPEPGGTDGPFMFIPK